MKRNTLSLQAKKYYSPSQKVRIIQELRSDNRTLRNTTRKYQLSKEKITYWNRWYARCQYLSYFRAKFTACMPDKDQHIKHLEQQLKQAKEHIDRLEVKNEALQWVIELAEKQLGIDIRKKSGSK